MHDLNSIFQCWTVTSVSNVSCTFKSYNSENNFVDVEGGDVICPTQNERLKITCHANNYVYGLIRDSHLELVGQGEQKGKNQNYMLLNS